MCVCVCVCVCVSMRAPVSLCLGGRGAHVYVEQMNVHPVNHLEIQLNYITAISLARERSVLQPRVIFVIIKLVCYSRLQKRRWLVKGVCYVSGGHREVGLRVVMLYMRDRESSHKTHC